MDFKILKNKIRWIYCPSEMSISGEKTLKDIDETAFEIEKMLWYTKDIFGEKSEKVKNEIKSIKDKLLFLYVIVESRINHLSKKDYDTMIGIHKSKLDEKITVFEKEIKEMKKELSEQNRNLLVIMGIFLSIFSIISVNISFFSQFENNDIFSWVALIIIVNLTLCGSIKFLLYSIRKITS